MFRRCLLFTLLFPVFQISAQNIGISATSPTEKLTIGNGNIRLNNSLKGIVMNGTDMPLITRGWDAFTSGSYSGLGRWGLFMQPHNITIGLSNYAGAGFRVSSYNVNSSIEQNLLVVKQDGNADVNGEVERTNKTGFADLVPACYGRVQSDGTITSGTGNFTISKLGTGHYRLAVTGVFPVFALIMVTPLQDGGLLYSATGRSEGLTGFFVIYTFNWDAVAADCGFTFIIYDP